MCELIGRKKYSVSEKQMNFKNINGKTKSFPSMIVFAILSVLNTNILMAGYWRVSLFKSLNS